MAKKLIKISIGKIIVKKQARKQFPENSIKSLAESIKKNGLLNPITITKKNVLIAGERRLRACKDILKWKVIEAIVVPDYEEENLIFLQLAENMQREDLSPNDACEILTKIFTTKIGIKRENLFGFLMTAKMLESVKKSMKELKDSQIYLKHQKEKQIKYFTERIKSYNYKKYERAVDICNQLGMTLQKAYKIVSLNRIHPEIRKKIQWDHQGSYNSDAITLTFSSLVANLTQEDQMRAYLYYEKKPNYKNLKAFIKDMRTLQVQEIRKKYIPKSPVWIEKLNTKIERARQQGYDGRRNGPDFEYMVKINQDIVKKWQIPIDLEGTEFFIIFTERQLKEIKKKTYDKGLMRFIIEKQASLPPNPKGTKRR